MQNDSEAPSETSGLVQKPPPPLAGTPAAAVPVAPDADPVKAAERSELPDVLRGFALLGILLPNSLLFAFPQTIQIDADRTLQAALERETTRVDYAALSFIDLFAHGKMIIIFAMLFGAGAVFFDQKTRGAQPGPLSQGAGLWYRRMAILAGVGFLHGLLFWYGDILLLYAVCGMAALWWCRRLSPKALLAIGAASYLLVLFAMTGFGVLGAVFASAADLFDSRALARELEGFRGGWLDAFLARGMQLIFMYFMLFVFIPMVGGWMLWGMALTRLGVLTGKAPARVYQLMAGIGLPLGALLTIAGWYFLSTSAGNPANLQIVWMMSYHGMALPVSIGYIGLLGWIVVRGRVAWLRGALAAVGRMAFSNYLLHTLVFTTLMYGYGFGLFGSVPPPQLLGIVAAIWVVNIVSSLLWLRAFRFGPAEWAWRCLTYGRLHPIRRVPAASPT